MPVVTEEQYKIALETERIARNYGIPREELMKLIRLGFEAGQRQGLTTFAATEMGRMAVQA